MTPTTDIHDAMQSVRSVPVASPHRPPPTLTEYEPPAAPQMAATLSFLLEERDELRRRAERHLRRAEWYLWWGLGCGMVMGVAITIAVIGYSIPGPWWLRIMVTTTSLPLGGMARFFQNRYKEGLREQERLRKQIVQQIQSGRVVPHGSAGKPTSKSTRPHAG